MTSTRPRRRPARTRLAGLSPAAARAISVLGVALVLTTAPGCASHGGFFSPSAAGNSDSGNTGNTDTGNGGSDSGDSSEDDSDGSSRTVTVAGGVLLVLAVVFMVVATVKKADEAKVQAYLEARRRPIRVSLARGTGLLIDEVATALSLPAAEVPTLAAALRASRDRLDRWLIDPEITAQEARGFSADLSAALAAAPSLTPYLTAARARLAAALGG